MENRLLDKRTAPRFEELSAKIRRKYLEATYYELEEMAGQGSIRAKEKRFLNFITLGNAVLADEYLGRLRNKDEAWFHVGEMSASPVQQARYSIVAAVTLFCRTAIDGGLPENLAYRISDSYLQYLDNTENVDDIQYLFLSAFREYCQVMQDWRLQVCRPEVKRCCEHILLHIHEPISLGDLAELAHLSPNHLSALFVKETGFRPTEYIRAQKLNYARYILESYSPPITTLANLLAFPSPSAFSQQFKRQYGVTPTEYLKRVRE